MATEIYVGKKLGPIEFIASPERIREYIDGVLDNHPWYSGDSPFGGPVAPALIFHSLSTMFNGWMFDNKFGTLYTRQEWTLSGVLRPGQRATAVATITDRYHKRGREYVALTVELRDAQGLPLARGVHHQSFLLDQSQGEARLKSSETKTRPAPVPSSEEIPPLHKTVTLEMCQAFYAGPKNYHNDLDAARAWGFKDVVIGGPMSLCFLSQLMTNRFGKGWYLGGHMDVKLVNVLWPNEPATPPGQSPMCGAKKTTAPRPSLAPPAPWKCERGRGGETRRWTEGRAVPTPDFTLCSVGCPAWRCVRPRFCPTGISPEGGAEAPEPAAGRLW